MDSNADESFQQVIVYSMPDDSHISQTHELGQGTNQTSTLLHIEEQAEPLIHMANRSQSLEQMADHSQCLELMADQSQALTAVANGQALHSLQQSVQVAGSGQPGGIGSFTGQSSAIQQTPEKLTNVSERYEPTTSQSQSLNQVRGLNVGDTANMNVEDNQEEVIIITFVSLLQSTQSM